MRSGSSWAGWILVAIRRQVRSVAGVAGRPAFAPQLLVSLWVYSYSRGESSARAIERLCEHEPAYQWLTGMEGISAHTLSTFGSRMQTRCMSCLCRR